MARTAAGTNVVSMSAHRAGQTRNGLRPLLLLAVCLAAPLLIASSCDGPYLVGTLHAPYTRDDLISDNQLLGTWAHGVDTLTIVGMGEGHYRMGDFSRPADSTKNDLPPFEVRLFLLGNAEVLDWSALTEAEMGSDLAGARVCLPVVVRVIGDTLWLSDIDPEHLPEDSILAADSITWIDRGDVRLLRGPDQRVRALLLRLIADPRATSAIDRYVKVPMGQGPDAMPEEALQD